MMTAKDVMTEKVISISPDTTVSETAQLLIKKRISAVPVVDQEQRVVGVVSESDLMHRPESGTDKRRGSWWLNLFKMPEDMANEYSKAHGNSASDVMTTPAITVPEGMSVGEIARILEEHHIKRVPVVRDGRLIGIVSRANLLHGLATFKEAPASPSAATDQAIREDIMHTLADQEWASLFYANVTVEDGVAHLWGMAETDAQIKAIEVVAANATGVTSVENHIKLIDPRMFYEG